ncbi:hypothetical protein FOA52_009606 [Chlamydomonas sp. UWO 241]|nr:hypothetical protein FOA52_009606 [Chlamydomonas sp. UWO 241]
MSQPPGYRDTSRGDAIDKDKVIREQRASLEAAKQANLQLKALNQRLERKLTDLSGRLADLEAGRVTYKGESSAMAELRSRTSNAKVQSQADGAQMSTLMSHNAELIEHVGRLHQDLRIAQATADDAVAGTRRSDVALAEQSLLGGQAADVLQKYAVQERALADLHAQHTALVAERDGLVTRLQASDATSAAAKAVAVEDARKQAAEETQRSVLHAHASISKARSDGEVAAATRDAQIAAMEARISTSRKPPPLPRDLTVDELSMAAAGSVGSSAPQRLSGPPPPSSSESSGGSNAIELLLHDIIPSQGVPFPAWPFLCVDAPGFGRHVLGPLLPGNAVPVSRLLRLHFGPEHTDKATALLGGAARFTLLDARAGILGGLSLPGDGPNTGDMTNTRLLEAVAVDYDSPAAGALGTSTAIELLELAPTGDAAQPPLRHVMTLSTDWRSVMTLTQGVEPPGPAEFAVCLHAFHKQQLDGARACGLFLTTGRTFQGKDGLTYQLWGVAGLEARAKATQRRLPASHAGLPLEPDGVPLGGASTVGRASMPLSSVLSTPSVACMNEARREALLAGQTESSMAQAYAPSPAAGTLELPFHNDASDRTVARLRATPRLSRGLDMGAVGRLVAQQMQGDTSAAPAAAAAAGAAAAAAAAPPWVGSTGGNGRSSEWCASLAGCQSLLLPLLSRVTLAAEGASLALCCNPAGDAMGQQQARQAAGQAAEALRQVLPPLAEQLAAIGDVAEAASQDEAGMAREQAALLCGQAARCVMRAACRLRLQAQLCAAQESLWGTMASGGGDGGGGTQAVAPPLSLLQAALLLEVAQPLVEAVAKLRLHEYLDALACFGSADAVDALGLRQHLDAFACFGGADAVDAIGSAGVASAMALGQAAERGGAAVMEASEGARLALGASVAPDAEVGAITAEALHRASTGLVPASGSFVRGMAAILDAAAPGLAVSGERSGSGGTMSTAAHQLLSALAALQHAGARLAQVGPSDVAGSPGSAGAWLLAATRMRCLQGGATVVFVASSVVASSARLAAAGCRLPALAAGARALGTETERGVALVAELAFGGYGARSVDAAALSAAGVHLARALQVHVCGVGGAANAAIVAALTTPMLEVSEPSGAGGAGTTGGDALSGVGLRGPSSPCRPHILSAAPLPLAALSLAASTRVSDSNALLQSLQAAAHPVKGEPVPLLTAGWTPRHCVLLLDGPGVIGPSADAVARAAALLGWRAVPLAQAAADPSLAGLPEASRAAALASSADALIVLGGGGGPAADPTGAAQSLAASGLPSVAAYALGQVGTPDADVARSLVARVVLATLHARAADVNRALAQVSTASGGGGGAPATARVTTFLDEATSGAPGLKALLDAVKVAHARVAQGLGPLTRGGSGSGGVLAGAAAAAATAAGVHFARQQLLLEGILAAAELLPAPSGVTPLASLPSMGARRGSNSTGGAVLGGMPSAFGGQGHTSALAAAQRAQAVTLMGSNTVGGPEQTESEDEEAHVVPLAMLGPMSGMRGRAADADSDGASVATASSLGFSALPLPSMASAKARVAPRPSPPPRPLPGNYGGSGGRY